MRNLTIVVAIFVIAVVAGSVYVHVGTRWFVENLGKTVSDKTLGIEDLHPHGEGPHQHGEDLNTQPKSQSDYDVAHFFDGQNHAEGFRQLRAADPKRAAEFEEFIGAEAHNPSSGICPEAIERAIQRSYELPQEN